jgi:TPR repeat protein
MCDVFISYAKEDRPRAEIFARALDAHGWLVFWDRTIRAGGTWRETIGRELQSARCVVVLWSKDSIDSDWVQEEADDAKQRHILVPVLINNYLPPIGFRSVQCADLSDWDGTEETPAFHRLIADIVALIGPSPKQVEEERRRQEALEAAFRAEEERQRAEAERLKQEEQRRRAEEKARLQEEAEAARRAAEERQRREAVEAERLAEEERKRREEPEAAEFSDALGPVVPADEAASFPAALPEAEGSQEPVGEVRPFRPSPPKKSRWPIRTAIAVVAVVGAALLVILKPSDEATVSQLTQQSDAGDARAAFQLGTMYLDGKGGLEVDRKKALDYYQRAVNLGDIGAYSAMANVYERGGYGVRQDYARAAEMYLKALNSGDNFVKSWSATQLGHIFEEGLSGRQDLSAACRYYGMAAQYGPPDTTDVSRVCGKGGKR